MTAPDAAASRWVVEIRDAGVWVPRCDARATVAEAGEVLARLQAKQPGHVFRVVEA